MLPMSITVVRFIDYDIVTVRISPGAKPSKPSDLLPVYFAYFAAAVHNSVIIFQKS